MVSPVTDFEAWNSILRHDLRKDQFYVKGTRIRADIIGTLLDAGYIAEDVKEMFPDLMLDDIAAINEWWRKEKAFPFCGGERRFIPPRGRVYREGEIGSLNISVWPD